MKLMPALLILATLGVAALPSHADTVNISDIHSNTVVSWTVGTSSLPSTPTEFVSISGIPYVDPLGVPGSLDIVLVPDGGSWQLVSYYQYLGVPGAYLTPPDLFTVGQQFTVHPASDYLSFFWTVTTDPVDFIHGQATAVTPVPEPPAIELLVASSIVVFFVVRMRSKRLTERQSAGSRAV